MVSGISLKTMGGGLEGMLGMWAFITCASQSERLPDTLPTARIWGVSICLRPSLEAPCSLDFNPPLALPRLAHCPPVPQAALCLPSHGQADALQAWPELRTHHCHLSTQALCLLP